MLEGFKTICHPSGTKSTMPLGSGECLDSEDFISKIFKIMVGNRNFT
jgi:hypothetical protein